MRLLRALTNDESEEPSPRESFSTCVRCPIAMVLESIQPRCGAEAILTASPAAIGLNEKGMAQM